MCATHRLGGRGAAPLPGGGEDADAVLVAGGMRRPRSGGGPGETEGPSRRSRKCAGDRHESADLSGQGIGVRRGRPADRLRCASRRRRRRRRGSRGNGRAGSRRPFKRERGRSSPRRRRGSAGRCYGAAFRATSTGPGLFRPRGLFSAVSTERSAPLPASRPCRGRGSTPSARRARTRSSVSPAPVHAG